jgi:hypothetical protein
MGRIAPGSFLASSLKSRFFAVASGTTVEMETLAYSLPPKFSFRRLVFSFLFDRDQVRVAIPTETALSRDDWVTLAQTLTAMVVAHVPERCLDRRLIQIAILEKEEEVRLPKICCDNAVGGPMPSEDVRNTILDRSFDITFQ